MLTRCARPYRRTQALPHRTQILYLPDIAFITNYLDVKAGSRVIEAGESERVPAVRNGR